MATNDWKSFFCTPRTGTVSRRQTEKGYTRMDEQASPNGAATAPTNEQAPTLSLEDFLEIVAPELSPEDAKFEQAESEREARRKARLVSPGPWSYEDTYDASCGSCCTPDGCMENHRSGLYRIVGPDWYDYDTVYPDVVCNEADARLIAAAPDLYAVVKAIAEDASAYQWHAAARAALAKAEGK